MKGKSQLQLQNVSLDVVILDVLNVDQEDSVFEVFYSIKLQWYDQALNYEFLRLYSGNPLKNISNIWKPNLKFYHIVKEDLIEKVINIQRNHLIQPTLSGDFDTLNLKEVYKGSDHPLQLMIKTRQTAVCSFPNIQYYPFREETCFIQFYIQGKDLKGR